MKKNQEVFEVDRLAKISEEIELEPGDKIVVLKESAGFNLSYANKDIEMLKSELMNTIPSLVSVDFHDYGSNYNIVLNFKNGKLIGLTKTGKDIYLTT